MSPPEQRAGDVGSRAYGGVGRAEPSRASAASATSPWGAATAPTTSPSDVEEATLLAEAARDS